MSASMHILPNGLTVAVDPMPGAESVAVGLYAQVGSRSEPDHLSGLAHLVEHMVFKGAGGRDTVDHRAGGHDDVANAACGALVLVLDAARYSQAPVVGFLGR